MKTLAVSLIALSMLAAPSALAEEPGWATQNSTTRDGPRTFPEGMSVYSAKRDLLRSASNGLSQADRERYRSITQKNSAEETASFLVGKAKDGNVWAMKELGAFYAGEGGLANHPEKSLYWFHEAAKTGDHASALLVGVAFAQGVVVEADTALARFWLEKAAASQDSAIRQDAEKQLASL